MKLFLLFASSLVMSSLHSQTLQKIDKDLSLAFAKIAYWSDYSSEHNTFERYDSLEKANADFEKITEVYCIKSNDNFLCVSKGIFQWVNYKDIRGWVIQNLFMEYKYRRDYALLQNNISI